MNTELRLAKAIKGFNLIRHEMHHFIKTFFTYLMHEVVEVEWNNFAQGVKKAKSMDDIIILHNKFLT